jgi:hypothetical protein
MNNAESDYLNHVMGCESCWPSSNRLCSVGRETWIESKVEWFMTTDKKYDRRVELEQLKAFDPDYVDEIEKRFVKLYAQRNAV